MRSTPPSAEAARIVSACVLFARSVRIGFSAVLAAPAVMVGRCAFYLLLMLVLAAFWDKVAAERYPGGLAHVLPLGGLALYIGVTEWVTLGTPSIYLRLEDDIRSGGLDARLLRPKSHLLLRLGEGCGTMLARMLAIGVAALFALALSGRHGPPLVAWPAILVLGLLGAVLGLMNLVLVGLTAFWLRRTLAVYLVNQKASFILGGLLAPITLYPPWLERISALSPYAGMQYWPAAMTLTPTAAVFLHALTVQLVWIAIFGAAILGLWTAGLRKVLREGG